MKYLTIILLLVVVCFTAHSADKNSTQVGMGLKMTQDFGGSSFQNVCFQISTLWPKAGVFADATIGLNSRQRIIWTPSITLLTVGLQWKLVEFQSYKGLIAGGYGYGTEVQEIQEREYKKVYQGVWYGIRVMSPALSEKWSSNISLTLAFYPRASVTDGYPRPNLEHNSQLLTASIAFNI